ncbi:MULTISPECIES: hypothetical protein [Natrialba]|nr:MULTISPECIES: hypothetical protein [Natrialba]
MTDDHLRFSTADRGIESIQSGLLLFGFSILLSLFMGAVIFLNGG